MKEGRDEVGESSGNMVIAVIKHLNESGSKRGRSSEIERKYEKKC